MHDSNKTHRRIGVSTIGLLGTLGGTDDECCGCTTFIGPALIIGLAGREPFDGAVAEDDRNRGVLHKTGGKSSA